MNLRDRTSFLFDRYVKNSCSKDELQEFFQLIKKRDQDTDVQEALRDIWNDTGTEQTHSEEEWESIYLTILALSAKDNVKLSSSTTWRKIAVAATIIIGVSAGLFAYMNRSESSDLTTLTPALAGNKIDPGGNKATLTLADGTKVILDSSEKGLIANQAGVQVLKAANGQIIYNIEDNSTAGSSSMFNTIETPKGGEFQLVMPDGTRIWLNAMSSLTYPLSFNGRERKITLKGEAYFEVAKSKHIPFIVRSGNQTVQVLGTHFNINSYSNQKLIETTLLEGAVRVSSIISGNTAYLKPGQQSRMQSDSFEVKAVDVDEAIAWKNGNFVFNKCELEDIMKQLSRWYDIEVVYQNEEVKHYLFSGTVSRFKDAAEILGVLELTRLVHFKIEGRRVIVMK